MYKFCPSVHKILQTLQMTLCRILQLITTKGFPVAQEKGPHQDQSEQRKYGYFFI